MQIGFIGLGAVVETAYLPALRRLGDVIDRCQGYDLDCSRALPGIQRCSSLSALLAEPLDTLFITTSSLQHLPVLERALASGISRIVVEKPIVANLEQAARLRALLAARPPQGWQTLAFLSQEKALQDLGDDDLGERLTFDDSRWIAQLQLTLNDGRYRLVSALQPGQSGVTVSGRLFDRGEG